MGTLFWKLQIAIYLMGKNISKYPLSWRLLSTLLTKLLLCCLCYFKMGPISASMTDFLYFTFPNTGCHTPPVMYRVTEIKPDQSERQPSSKIILTSFDNRNRNIILLATTRNQRATKHLWHNKDNKTLWARLLTYQLLTTKIVSLTFEKVLKKFDITDI